MTWTVNLTRKAVKQKDSLPKNVKSALIALIHEIVRLGPIRGDWPNYGKLGSHRHHCHLKKGLRPMSRFGKNQTWK